MKERIMFVDDDPRLLAGLRRAVGAQGEAWDMEFVKTAGKAGESPEIRPFDVLVVDIRMAGKSGLDLLKQKNLPIRHGTPK